VLAIGVEGDHDVGSAIECEGNARTERSTLPAIDRMPQYPHGVYRCYQVSRIPGTVVDNDDFGVD
jgi:hypothetical protein